MVSHLLSKTGGNKVDSFFQDMLDEKEQLDEKIRNSRFYRKVKTNTKMATNRYKTDGSKIEITLNQKEYYSQKDIAGFNLESYSKLIPDHDGYKVITSTYFVRFWGPVFDYKPKPQTKPNEKKKIVRRSGGIIAYTYIILKSYCWGKDYCWISLQTLADNLTVSKNAVRGYLEQLEEEGFIIRFWRESDKNGNVEEESMLIKVRQTIPFLTKAKLDFLPDTLKKEHDDFLRYIRLESEKEFEDAYNYTEVYENLRNKKLEVKAPGNGMTPYELLISKQSEKDKMTWNVMKERMKHYVKDDSIKQWFGDGIALLRDDTLIVYVGSEWKKENIENKYQRTLYSVMQDILVPAKKIKIETYES
jgi:DNA-binding Lrp family transcriptional regulator